MSANYGNWSCLECGNQYASEQALDTHACEGGECAICVPGQCPGTGCPGNYGSEEAATIGAHRIRRAWTFARTCMHAAKLLPTVRRAVPWYVWPILAVAAVVKCMPLDFGTDEALFAIAFALIAWRRPGLLKALYREAQSGKPAPCQCEAHSAPKVRRVPVLARVRMSR